MAVAVTSSASGSTEAEQPDRAAIERADLFHVGEHLERPEGPASIERWCAIARPGQALLVDDPWLPPRRTLLARLTATGVLREADPGLPSCGDVQRYVRT